MLSLKTAHELNWGELQYIENPMVAKTTVERNNGNSVNGEPIHNANNYNLPDAFTRSFDPYSDIHYKLENGHVFLVNTSTTNPLLKNLKISDKQTTLCTIMPGQTLMFKNAVDAMLRYVRVPQISGVLRQEPAKKTQQDDEAKPVKKKLLTIAKIARKLRQIEGGSRYEEAIFFASKIGWEGICSLVEEGHPENDPNLMPSRYMILPGASDEELRKKGNLNNFSQPLHKNAPKQLSVYNLKQFLILGGYLKGDKPYWQSPDQQTQEELDKLQKDGGLEKSEVSPLTGVAIMDGEVESALNDFLGKQTLPDPSGGTSYTVKDGDTLSSIAKSNDFPNWQVLWNYNKQTIKNPDLIYPGFEIDLPDLRNDDLEPWFHEFDNGQDVWQGSKHYKFPASYFSLTLVNRNGEEIKEKLSSEFQGYLKSPHLFYCFNIKDPEDIQMLMPICDNSGAGFKDDEFIDDNIELKAFETILYGDKKNTASSQLDADDDEELTPDNVELV